MDRQNGTLIWWIYTPFNSKRKEVLTHDKVDEPWRQNVKWNKPAKQDKRMIPKTVKSVETSRRRTARTLGKGSGVTENLWSSRRWRSSEDGFTMRSVFLRLHKDLKMVICMLYHLTTIKHVKQKNTVHFYSFCLRMISLHTKRPIPH